MSIENIYSIEVGTFSHLHTCIILYRIARNTEDDFSLLRSKLLELHPVHKATLGALLRHFSRVTSHRDKNAMSIKALAERFSYAILRGNQVMQGGFYVKVRCIDLL